MPAKYLVALDRLHLRIYRFSQQPGQFTPSIQPVDALDLTDDRSPYDTGPQASGGDSSDPTSRSTEFMNDDSSPNHEDHAWSLVEHLVERISRFLEKNPDSTWNLAASSALRNQVIDALPENLRRRLDQVITKDLVNVPPVELREHFALR